MVTRWLIAVVVSVMLVGSAAAQGEDRPTRVGRVNIEGNTATPGDVILKLFELHPGQAMNPRNVRAGEERLRKCGLFRVNRWRSISPTVEIVPNDFGNEYLDVWIRVEERPWNFVAFALTELAGAALEGDLRDLQDAAYRLWRGSGGGG